MADIFVDNTGSNTAPYDTEAKAAILLQTALTAWSTGDRVLMIDTHNETVATTITYSGGSISEPIPVYRVTPTTHAYSPTSGSDTKNIKTSTSNDTITLGSLIFHGVYFEPNGHIQQSATTRAGLIDCKVLQLGNLRGIAVGYTNSDAYMQLDNTIFDSATGQVITLSGGFVTIRGCSWTGSVASTGLIRTVNNRSISITLEDCDLSGITDSTVILVDASLAVDSGYSIDFVSCKFPTPATSLSLTDGVLGHDGQSIATYFTDQGSDLWPMDKELYRGTILTDSSIYHDAGAVDQDASTNISYDMQSSSVCRLAAPLSCFDIVQWYDATGTVTVTVECWDGFTTALQDDEAWMEVSYYDGTDVLKTIVTTRVISTDTTSNLTPGTGPANWTGEPSGRSVKFVVSGLTIGKKGMISARIFLGSFESGKSLLVDPLMAIA